MNQKNERRLTFVLLALTAGATVLAFLEIAAIGVELARQENWLGVGTQIAFAIVVLVLTYGFFVYFVTRIGRLQRLARHVPADRGALEQVFAGEAPRVVVLVPSYKEEAAIVRRTLLSAALQEFPHRRVVLLIDDPYRPADAADAAALEGMRRLPRDLQQLFAAPAARFDRAASDFAATPGKPGARSVCRGADPGPVLSRCRRLVRGRDPPLPDRRSRRSALRHPRPDCAGGICITRASCT